MFQAALTTTSYPNIPTGRPRVLFWLGERGKCVMHRSVRSRRVWDSSTACRWAFSPVGQSAACPTLPRVLTSPLQDSFLDATACTSP